MAFKYRSLIHNAHLRIWPGLFDGMTTFVQSNFGIYRTIDTCTKGGSSTQPLWTRGTYLLYVGYISHVQPAQVDYRSRPHSWINRYPTWKSRLFIIFVIKSGTRLWSNLFIYWSIWYWSLGGYPYFTLLYKYHTTNRGSSASQPFQTPKVHFFPMYFTALLGWGACSLTLISSGVLEVICAVYWLAKVGDQSNNRYWILSQKSLLIFTKTFTSQKNWS